MPISATGSLTSISAGVDLAVRRRIAWRLLPFVFVLYLINYIDRVNVSFAALRMKTDLGFSDIVYGFGVSLFFLSYVLFEIPGAVLVERWSARKWISRIMVSWGLVTVLTAFIHTSRQFYVARLLLGAAEASFFPGIIVYLTHWFTVKDRARAIAVFYAAIPVSNFIGSALAGWLLGIHWRGIAGWRWLFILEGLPAILFGVITLFYLTDRPAQAKWLTEAERVLINEKLLAERSAKSRGGRFSIWQASKDRRVYVLVAGYFFYQMAVVSNAFWMPTFLQRLSHLPATAVARLVMVPAITGLAGLFANSSLSDKSGEHKWHTVVPLLCAGCCYFFILPAAGHFSMVVMLFAVFNFFSLAAVPSFWSIPTLLFSETTAAVLFGLITSIGQLGGFVGPSMIAYFNDKTHSIHGSLGFISSALLISCFILSLLPSSAKRDN